MRKHEKSKLTMAIGDGANDVSMIQSAHVGVGVKGHEGNQASSFADYAIPRFKDLRRLLFWHGRGFGIKIGMATRWILFKSITFAFGAFFYSMYNGFSGQ